MSLPLINLDLVMILKNRISIILILLTGIVILSCQNPEPGFRNPKCKLPQLLKNEKTAVFAEGCFWHSELVFQSLVGVRDAVSGYAGGTNTDPYYELVSTGNTGHAECVMVYYDTTQISYEKLVKAFFASHDPTSINRQGQDIGSEYRSMIFYNTPEEKRIIENEIQELSAEKKYGKAIVTEVLPLKKFYEGEEFHQEYVEKHPESDYVRFVSVPEFLSFKLSFKADYKPIDFLEY